MTDYINSSTSYNHSSYPYTASFTAHAHSLTPHLHSAVAEATYELGDYASAGNILLVKNQNLEANSEYKVELSPERMRLERAQLNFYMFGRSTKKEESYFPF